MNVEKKKKEAAANSAQANSEVEKIAESPVKEKLSILGRKYKFLQHISR